MIHCYCSVTKLCPTLCDPMAAAHQAPCPSLSPGVCSNSCPLSQMPSNHLILCCPLLLLPSIFPSTGSFPISWHFASGSQSIGASPSASDLPMNIQGWFPLGWTSLITLLSKGLSRVLSSTQFEINSLVLSLLYGQTLIFVCNYWKNHSFD